MTLVNCIKKKIRWHRFLRKWKNKNHSNFTIPVRTIPLECVQIGVGTYGKINAYNCSKDAKLIVGNYCSIADEVSFLLSVEHPLDRLSTYPYKTMYCNMGYVDACSKGDIVIDDDVWIGFRCVIMSGVHIGQGAVVAAGAVVTKDIPPYAVVGGVPAKILKYRFEKNIVDRLIRTDLKKIIPMDGVLDLKIKDAIAQIDVLETR